MSATVTPAIRAALGPDAPAMAELLNALIARGGSTAYRQPFDADRLAATFIAPERGICCFCAENGGAVVGFQSLEWVDPDWPGPDRLPADWAIISTYVALGRHGQGIGRRLFGATIGTARAAGVRHIDATIRRENSFGLGYYAGIGFRDYRAGEETVSKVFEVS